MSNTLLQPASLLAMLYGGIVAGLLYDGCRLPRRLFHGRLVCTLFDTLFVLGCAALAIYFLLLASGGEVRAYLCAGFAAGFLLEQWSISFIIFQLFYKIRSSLLKK